ncbi:MAG: hypothetical protein EA380_03685 [Phycisphaeraceae bacterium]|nr:MAG: hypothetical protein EA380_03685 [Phycisphaeraceae bacterium]
MESVRADSPTQTPNTPEPPEEGGALFRFDTGWLYLLPGLALICATVLIPAYDDLSSAEFQRSQAFALEQYRSERLRSYAAYLSALNRNDETVLLGLAATHLNLIPSGMEVLIAPAGQISDLPASPFPALEPEYRPPSPPVQVDSLLRRLAVQDTTRLWLIAGGMMCILIGLLPSSRAGRGFRARRGADTQDLHLAEKEISDDDWDGGGVCESGAGDPERA